MRFLSLMLFSKSRAMGDRKRKGMFSFIVDWCSVTMTASSLIMPERSFFRFENMVSGRVLMNTGVSSP